VERDLFPCAIGNQLYVRAPSARALFFFDLLQNPGANEKTSIPTNRLRAVRLRRRAGYFVANALASGAPQALQDGLDERAGRRLRPLGYMASEKTQPVYTHLTPKDRIDVANDMHDGSLAMKRKEPPFIRCCCASWPKTRNSGSPVLPRHRLLAAGQLCQSHFPPLRKAIRAAAGWHLRRNTTWPISLYETGVLEWRCLVFRDTASKTGPIGATPATSLASFYART